MKNSRKGFIVPLLLIIIALLLVGGGSYLYVQKSQTTAPVMGNSLTQVASTTHGTNEPSTAGAPSIPSAPGITSISPSSGPVGTVVTLDGYFPNGATVSFDGNIVAQTVTDMHSFSFVIPNTVKAEGMGAPPFVSVYPGKHSISLSAESPTGNPVEFTVTPTPPETVDPSTPKVTTVIPSTIIAGQTRNVTIVGSNFSLTNVVAIVGSGLITSVAPTTVSQDGTSIVFTFPEALTVPDLYNVGVYERGGVQGYVRGGHSLLSSSVTITLINPHAPTITAISPKAASVGNTVTIMGSNFYGDTRIYAGTYLPSTSTGSGPIVPSSYTTTSLSFVIPSSMSPGQYVITASGPGGYKSGVIMFTVTAP